MDREYWESQVELIDIVQRYCGEIRSMKIYDEGMDIITKVYDDNMVNELDTACAEYGFEWNYEPYTLRGKCNKTTVKEYPAVRFTFTLI